MFRICITSETPCRLKIVCGARQEPRRRILYVTHIWLYQEDPPSVGGSRPNPCRTRAARPNPCHRSRFEEAGRRLSSNGPRTRAEAISKLIYKLGQSGLRHESQAEPVPSLPEPVPAHIPRWHPVFEKGKSLTGVFPCKLPEYSQTERMTSSKSCNQDLQRRWVKSVSQPLAATGSV